MGNSISPWGRNKDYEEAKITTSFKNDIKRGDFNFDDLLKLFLYFYIKNNFSELGEFRKFFLKIDQLNSLKSGI